MTLTIAPADQSDVRLQAFLQQHLDDMAPTGPPESQHALDLDGLRRPGIRVWVARESDADDAVVGTIALAPVSDGHEELKSMRTDPQRRRAGIASQLLQHALDDARVRGITRVSLETGSMEFFAPARAFYRRHGFVDCDPFGAYVPDPNSAFLTRSV